jgi:hypothetical protein
MCIIVGTVQHKFQARYYHINKTIFGYGYFFWQSLFRMRFRNVYANNPLLFLLICKGLTNDEMQCIIINGNLVNFFS